MKFTAQNRRTRRPEDKADEISSTFVRIPSNRPPPVVKQVTKIEFLHEDLPELLARVSHSCHESDHAPGRGASMADEFHALLLRRAQTARQGRPLHAAAGKNRVGSHRFPPGLEKRVAKPWV